MSSWKTRSAEERSLLNPGFCAVLLWQAAKAHADDSGTFLPLELTFLVAPIVLHRETRESLPKAVTTSLAVWLEEHPLVRPLIFDRARTLVPFTKEALNFGGLHGLLKLEHHGVVANLDWSKRVNSTLKSCTEEVRACTKRAAFVGKWFFKAGSAATVMALIGVRP